MDRDEIMSKTDILNELEDLKDLPAQISDNKYKVGYKDAISEAQEIIEEYLGDREVGSMHYTLDLETENLEEQLSEVEAEIEKISSKLTELGMKLQINGKEIFGE